MNDEDRKIAEYEEAYGLLDGDEELITRDSIWTARNGQRIAIRDMTDSHLLNAIRVLRNMSPIGTTFKTTDVRRRMWVNAMANEAYARGLWLDELIEKEPVHE